VTTLTDTLANPLLAGIYRTPEPQPLPPGMIRLDRNERVGAYGPDVAAEIVARLDGERLSGYPDVSALYAKLARWTSLPKERLLLVPGSDAAFRSLAHAFVGPGDPVAMIDPSYQMYPVYARMFGGVAVQIPIRDDLTIDRAALADATSRSKMLWLANPNQPSATLVPIGDLVELTEEAERSGTVVVVDEAYYPFSGATVLDQVTRHENLVVVRTFSKAFGLAGVRLGFVAASRTMIELLFKARTSFDINALAIVAGEWALAHTDVVARYVAETARSNALLADLAARHGLFAPPSATNFQLIKVGPRFDPLAIKQACWDKGFAICAPAGTGALSPYLRVTTGALDVIGRFARVLEGVLAESHR
jgi:histidinol-phosphate aminotransferase